MLGWLGLTDWYQPFRPLVDPLFSSSATRLRVEWRLSVVTIEPLGLVVRLHRVSEEVAGGGHVFGEGAVAVIDLAEFAAGVIELHQRLVRVTFALGGDRELAEECAQEALLRAWQRLESGQHIDSMEAWCVTVALNCCRSELRRSISDRRKVARLAVLAPTNGGMASDQQEALGDDVRLAVLALPMRQREVVVLHYLLDLGVAEIASMTGRSQGAVKNALHHARQSLGRSLDSTAASMEESHD